MKNKIISDSPGYPVDTSFLTDFSQKDKPWDDHKSESVRVADLYNQNKFTKYSDRVSDCSNRLAFAITKANEAGECKLKLTGTQFCRVRHCPVCQWRRSLKWRGRFLEALPKIRLAYPSHRFIFATLTQRNCPISELRSNLIHLGESFVRLTRNKAWSVTGWVRSTEITRNSSTGEAHPHYHCLLMVPPVYFGRDYLSTAKWAEKWQKSLKVDYLPIVHFKAIKAHLEANLIEQVCHVLKYSVKPADLMADPNWLGELTTQVANTRAVATGGIFKKYLAEEKDDDNLINIKEDSEEEEIDQEEAELFFKFHHQHKKYTRV